MVAFRLPHTHARTHARAHTQKPAHTAQHTHAHADTRTRTHTRRGRAATSSALESDPPRRAVLMNGNGARPSPHRPSPHLPPCRAAPPTWQGAAATDAAIAAISATLGGMLPAPANQASRAEGPPSPAARSERPREEGGCATPRPHREGAGPAGMMLTRRAPPCAEGRPMAEVARPGRRAAPRGPPLRRAAQPVRRRRASARRREPASGCELGMSRAARGRPAMDRGVRGGRRCAF